MNEICGCSGGCFGAKTSSGNNNKFDPYEEITSMEDRTTENLDNSTNSNVAGVCGDNKDNESSSGSDLDDKEGDYYSCQGCCKHRS
eukprot:15336155-Ditylum_brightwellii.AAC.1